MAGYESAQLVESLDEESVDVVLAPKQRAKQWRWLGLALAVVGIVGTAAGMNWPSRRISPVERLSMVHSALMAAFNSRALLDAPTLQTSLSFLLQEVDKEPPSAMGVDVDISTGDEDTGLNVKVVFNAQTGKATDLKTKIDSIVKAFSNAKDPSNPDGGTQDLLFGMGDRLETVADEEKNQVLITFSLPEEPKKVEAELDEALQGPMPKFSGSFKVGRSFQEMYDNIDENLVTLPQGISANFDATFSTAVVKAVGDMGDIGAMAAQGAQGMKMMEALEKIKEHVEIRYTADASDSFGEAIPNLKEEMKHFEAELRADPFDVLKSFKGLETLADGIDTVEAKGLPQKYEITAKFDNFHVTPVLKKMIGLLEDAQEGNEGDADEADADEVKNPAK